MYSIYVIKYMYKIVCHIIINSHSQQKYNKRKHSNFPCISSSYIILHLGTGSLFGRVMGSAACPQVVLAPCTMHTVGSPPCRLFGYIGYQTHYGRVVCTFDEGVGAVGGSAVVSEKGVEEWTEDAALGGVIAQPDMLGSVG